MNQEADPTMMIVGGLALLLFIVTYMVGKNLSAYNNTKRRIRDLQSRRAELQKDNQSSKRKKAKAKKEEENIELIQKIVNKLNLVQENKVSEISDFLISAGYSSKNAIIKYTFAQFVCAFGFMALSLIFVDIDPSNLTFKGFLKLLIPFAAVYVGFSMPKILAVNNRSKRYKEVQKGLPDALDLMMICTEAGLTLSAALDRVSKELGKAYPILAEEIALTSIEIGFLPEKRKALENLSKRIALPEIRALTSILIQTEKYGTPVSQALRVLSKEFRTQRMLRAEQKAARLPAIMTVPMILFILPTMFIIVISPAAIGIMAK